MNTIKKSFKYGITSALLIILFGGMQACADASPMEPVTSSSTRMSATAAPDTVWVEGDGATGECVFLDGHWYCQGKPR